MTYICTKNDGLSNEIGFINVIGNGREFQTFTGTEDIGRHIYNL